MLDSIFMKRMLEKPFCHLVKHDDILGGLEDIRGPCSDDYIISSIFV